MPTSDAVRDPNGQKLKKPHRKLFGFLLIVPLFLFALYIIVPIAVQAYKDVTGYECFSHSFATTCEYPAKDADKVCTYDDECSSGACVYYETMGTMFLPLKVGAGGLSYIPEAEWNFPKNGRCDKYGGDNDGYTLCTRKRGEKVKCSGGMS